MVNLVKSEFYINLFNGKVREYEPTIRKGYVFQDIGLNFGVFKNREVKGKLNKWFVVELTTGTHLNFEGRLTRKKAIACMYFNIPANYTAREYVNNALEMAIRNISVKGKNDDVIAKLCEVNDV